MVTGAGLAQPGLAQFEVEGEVDEDRSRLAESRARFEEPLPGRVRPDEINTVYAT